MGLVKIREDILDRGEIPGILKGWPEFITFNENFHYAYLADDTEEGYNIVIWLPDADFIDLANTIDFDFIDF